MNTDNATLAARMYPDLPASTESLTVAPAANAQGSTATTTAPAKGAAPANAGAVSAAPTPPANAAAGWVSPAKPVAAVPTPAELSAAVDAYVGRELSIAERLQGAGQGFTDTSAAESAIGMKFEPMMADADEADRAALREGHRAAAAAMVDFGIGASDANEIAGTLARWDERVQIGNLPDQATLHQQRDRGLETLRQEWGDTFAVKVELARRACREAERRMPWLADLVDAGAGNDIAFVKQMAALGERMGRKARRAK